MRTLCQHLLYKVIPSAVVVVGTLLPVANSEAHGPSVGFRSSVGVGRSFNTRGFSGNFRTNTFNGFNHRGFNYGHGYRYNYGGFGNSFIPSFGYSGLYGSSYGSSYLVPNVIEEPAPLVVRQSVIGAPSSVGYSNNYSYETRDVQAAPTVRQETVIRKIIEVHELTEPNIQVQPRVQTYQQQSQQEYQVDPVPPQYIYQPSLNTINQETTAGYLSGTTLSYMGTLGDVQRVGFLDHFYGNNAERLFTRHYGNIPQHLRGHFHHHPHTGGQGGGHTVPHQVPRRR